MGTVKMAGARLLRCVMAVCLAATMAAGASTVLATAAPGKAYAAANQSVLDQRSGVFKFNWGINGVEYARGSAFLINDETIVTAYHCVMPSAWELERLGYSMQDVQDFSTYTVTIAGDFQVGATLKHVSEKQDLAILTLDQKLNGTKTLALRDSSDVDASEAVYSLGFPATADQNAVITFTSNDVSVIDGTVSKPEGQMKFRTNTHQECEGSFIMTTCRMEGGSSGGPMVDADGNVVGVCVSSDESFYYAAASDVLMSAIDTMNIKYTSASTSNPTPNPKPDPDNTTGETTGSTKTYTLSFSNLSSAIGKAESVDPSDYTEESYKALSDALAKAKEAQNETLDDPTDKDEYEKAQKKIDDATSALTTAQNNLKEVPEGFPLWAIIAIIVAVIAVIAIVVIVLVMRSRKKKRDEQTPTVPLGGASNAPLPGGSVGGMQPIGGRPAQGAFPAAGGAEVSETTILDDEASDTVILFQAASGGSLTRMSTNEQIPINSAEFTIGRERSKVNYCLEGNSSISRVHVRIVVRDGKVYLIDNRAANGTFVNGVKARPGEEILLKGGDIITLADEKLKYNS